MGGYGCGGRNKTHRTVEKYPRIDSFAFYSRLRGDKYTSYKDEIRYPGSTNPLVIYHPSEGYTEVKTGNYYSTLILSTVPGIDRNSTRLYWECPYCYRRVRYLYNKSGDCMCRHCLGANYTSQQRNRGTDAITRKAKKIIVDELGLYNWQQYTTGGIMDVRGIEKPPYMRWKKFYHLLAEYRQLQGEYILEMAKACGSFISEDDDIGRILKCLKAGL